MLLESAAPVEKLHPSYLRKMGILWILGSVLLYAISSIRGSLLSFFTLKWKADYLKIKLKSLVDGEGTEILFYWRGGEATRAPASGPVGAVVAVCAPGRLKPRLPVCGLA